DVGRLVGVLLPDALQRQLGERGRLFPGHLSHLVSGRVRLGRPGRARRDEHSRRRGQGAAGQRGNGSPHGVVLLPTGFRRRLYYAAARPLVPADAPGDRVSAPRQGYFLKNPGKRVIWPRLHRAVPGKWPNHFWRDKVIAPVRAGFPLTPAILLGGPAREPSLAGEDPRR